MTRIIVCSQCGREFEGRADAQTCSARCRQNRKRGFETYRQRDTKLDDKNKQAFADYLTKAQEEWATQKACPKGHLFRGIKCTQKGCI